MASSRCRPGSRARNPNRSLVPPSLAREPPSVTARTPGTRATWSPSAATFMAVSQSLRAPDETGVWLAQPLPFGQTSQRTQAAPLPNPRRSQSTSLLQGAQRPSPVQYGALPVVVLQTPSIPLLVRQRTSAAPPQAVCLCPGWHPLPSCPRQVFFPSCPRQLWEQHCLRRRHLRPTSRQPGPAATRSCWVRTRSAPSAMVNKVCRREAVVTSNRVTRSKRVASMPAALRCHE